MNYYYDETTGYYYQNNMSQQPFYKLIMNLLSKFI